MFCCDVIAQGVSVQESPGAHGAFVRPRRNFFDRFFVRSFDAVYAVDRVFVYVYALGPCRYEVTKVTG